ncbi:MAG: universal stress protein [Armatimonadetes bacterium]|nr:universal stress protein [Armatimonadota bacterium]
MRLEPLFRIAYTKVLVPVDCTPLSQRTLLEAARLMVPLTGAQMTLLATVPHTEGTSPEMDTIRQARWRHAEQALDQSRKFLRDYGYYVRTRIQVADDAAQALIIEAQENHYDLIVIGSHFNHTDEPCAPSEADKLLAALPMPVIVVDSRVK